MPVQTERKELDSMNEKLTFCYFLHTMEGPTLHHLFNESLWHRSVLWN